MNKKPFFYGIVILSILAAVQYASASNRIIHGGTIYTSDAAQPIVEAVVVEDGEFIFVGSRAEAELHLNESTEVIDLSGGMLLPGFIDTHNHVFEGASEAGGSCLLSPTKRLERQITELRLCQRDIVSAGDWVMGYGHQLDALWGNSYDLNPRLHLDEWFPDNPVIIMEESSHSMLVNSLALELAGITANSDHPPGGRIMFDELGEPNGVLFDNAGDLVMEFAWNSLDDNFQISYEGLLAGLDVAAGYGITTIGDGRLYWRRGWTEVWQKVLDDNLLTARVSARPWIYPELDLETQLTYLAKIVNGNRNSLLVFDQVKMYIDGVMHFGTAKMLKPYLSSWQEDLPLGLNYISPDQLPGILNRLDEIGYGAHIHAIGDGGVRETLDAIETMRNQNSSRLYSMTHLELIAAEDIRRFKSLSVHADFQAGAVYFDKTAWARSYIGSTRASTMLPMREVFDSGANVTFSSDWTVNPINPLVAIANSYRLRRSKGLPTIEDALHAATINGAIALGFEDITGSIEVGKSADFVILDTNLLEATASQIEDASVLLSALRGRVVYEK